MKLFFLTMFTCIALSISVHTNAAEVVAVQPNQAVRTTNVSYSVAPKSNVDVPNCYVQWANNDRLSNLSKLCGEQPKNSSRSQVTYPQPPAPYDQLAMKKFDDSLYGG